MKNFSKENRKILENTLSWFKSLEYIPRENGFLLNWTLCYYRMDEFVEQGFPNKKVCWANVIRDGYKLT